jgi:hypothetical protein
MLIYVCCIQHGFFTVSSLVLYQYNKYMFNFINTTSFIPVSGYDAVKLVLLNVL